MCNMNNEQHCILLQGFLNKVSFEEHVNKHTGLRPYKCEICEKSYRHKSVFQRHMDSHQVSCGLFSSMESRLAFIVNRLFDSTFAENISGWACEKATILPLLWVRI